MVVTGYGGSYSYDQVTVYTELGWLEDLPRLLTGRYYHACGHFVNELQQLVAQSHSLLLRSCGAGVPGDRRLPHRAPGLHRAAGGGGLHLGRGWALANSQVGGRREHALSVVSVADIQEYCH